MHLRLLLHHWFHIAPALLFASALGLGVSCGAEAPSQEESALQPRAPDQAAEALSAPIMTALAGGAIHTLTLRSDGTVWATGANDNGQLGDGTTLPQSRPDLGCATSARKSAL